MNKKGQDTTERATFYEQCTSKEKLDDSHKSAFFELTNHDIKDWMGYLNLGNSNVSRYQVMEIVYFML